MSFPIQVATQEITSADTSINVLNYVYTHLPVWKPNSLILDYGGGKYDTNIRYMYEKYGSTVLVYDPYNRSPEYNNNTQHFLNEKIPDYVVCSNVLNVCKEDSIIHRILSDLQQYSLKGAQILITVYEGNKSQTGCLTKKGWQRNMPLNNYIPFIEQYFNIVHKSHKIIACKN